MVTSVHGEYLLEMAEHLLDKGYKDDGGAVLDKVAHCAPTKPQPNYEPGWPGTSVLQLPAS